MRLGKRALDDLAKRWEAGRNNGAPVTREVVWDDELPGFGVRRQAKGAGLSFVLKYRVKGVRQQRWLSLGEYPVVHPDRARDEAREIRTAAAAGRDLVEERRADAARKAQEALEARRQGLPLSAVLDAFRASLEAERDRKVAEGRAGLYERELLRIEAKHVRPFVAGESVGGFDPERLEGLLDQMSGHSTAQMMRSLLARFVGFARPWLGQQGIRVAWQREWEVKQERPRPREHRFSLAEAAALWIGAGKLGRRGALVRFMLLTACRRSEAQRLLWEHVLLEDGSVGPHVLLPAVTVKHLRMTRIPLSPPAAALLRWLPVRETAKAGEARLVFAGRGNLPVGGWTDVRRALLRAARVKEGWLHDIRRTVVSILADRGWEPAVVDRLLNHAASATMPGVMAVYQRSELWDQQRRAVEAWADLLMAEVERQQKRPLSRESWGFEAPFEEVRIRRPRRRSAVS